MTENTLPQVPTYVKKISTAATIAAVTIAVGLCIIEGNQPSKLEKSIINSVPISDMNDDGFSELKVQYEDGSTKIIYSEVKGDELIYRM